MTQNRFREIPFLVLLLLFLYLDEGIFGLLSVSRIFTIIYFVIFLWGYKNDNIFAKPLLLLMVSMPLSMLSCQIYHDQSILDSLTPYVTYFAIAIFFALRKLDINGETIEKVLFWSFIVFCICYIYQIMVLPKLVFIDDDTVINYNLPIILRRVRMSGMSLVGLGVLYSLNKMLLHKIIYVIPFVHGLIVILLFGFRTLLAFIALFSFILVARNIGFSYKIFFGFALLVLFAYLFTLTDFGQQVWEQMQDRDEAGGNFGNSDYIRYTTLYYFYGEHFQSAFEMFLGSGIPKRGVGSAYELYYNRLEAFGLHYFDWGLLGMSWMMGMLSLVGMIWWPIRAFFTKMPKEKLYLSVWFGYLFACAFTSAEFVRQGCFLIQGMALYCITKYRNEKNSNSKQRHITATSC